MTVPISKAEWRWALRWAAVIVALSCLPYLAAWRLSPPGTVYTGLLINHYDGESYYAKMQQGARGDWLFHLPFTPEPHEGAFIFTFYLALGHVASASGIPIPIVYHLARVVAGLWLLLVGYRFIARFFERVLSRRAAFLLLALSAGFGWVFAPLGVALADLWVVEGFTFLTLLANPHFPAGIALMLVLLMSVLDLGTEPPRVARLAGAAGLGMLLAVVQPFAVPIVAVVLAAYLALVTLCQRQLPWSQAAVAAAAMAGSAPIMIYDLAVYRSNPALAAWSAQNVTASLPPWNYALSYGLVLLLAIPGLVVAARRRRATDLFLLAWVGSAAVLLYVPFALQRRFITGLHVPLVLLAAIGLEQVLWPRVSPRRHRWATGLLIAATSLTSFFVPLVAIAGVAAGGGPLVMTPGEAGACAWLARNTAWTETVLAPVESGQFVPAWAGNRVVYGHPFETIDAQRREAEVARFYSARTTAAERRDLLQTHRVRYVLVTPSSNLDLQPASLGLEQVWSGGGAVVYRVEDSS